MQKLMLKFKKFNENAIRKIQKFTAQSGYLLCDYSGGVLYMWNDHYNLSYATISSPSHGETLVLRSDFRNGETAFFLPIGPLFMGALNEIENYCVQNEMPLNYACVSEEYLPLLKNKYFIESDEFHRNWADYLYDYEEIVNFTGKKFSGQRNHINAFKKLYNYKLKKLTLKDIPRIKEFLKEYKKEHKGGKKIERREYANTLKLLDNYDKGKFIGAYIEIDGKICSFTVGEYTKNMLIIHIEKALRSYRGIYPTTFQEFARLCKKEGVNYINREDDSGDLGLRTSKLQYQPISIENKHYITVKNPMSVSKKPTLKGERVILNGIKREDANDYYKLSVNKTLNKYWGYDYKKDIKVPTPQAFFEMQDSDFKSKKSLSLAIRNNLNGKLIGEIIFHHFDYNEKVEVGVRLLKKYQGKGLAKEALSLAVNYAEQKLLKTPVAKCYKQNEKSLKALTGVGFEITGEDNKFYYLKKS